MGCCHRRLPTGLPTKDNILSTSRITTNLLTNRLNLIELFRYRYFTGLLIKTENKLASLKVNKWLQSKCERLNRYITFSVGYLITRWHSPINKTRWIIALVSVFPTACKTSSWAEDKLKLTTRPTKLVPQ